MTDPDFDRIADGCLSRVYDARGDGLLAEHGIVVEAIRQVWNARGAADAIVVAEDHDYLFAIKALDR